MNFNILFRQISRELKAFNANKKVGTGDVSKMKDLSKLIREMPQYQKDLKKYNTNFRLAEDCVKEQERIRLLCKIEQVNFTSHFTNNFLYKKYYKFIIIYLGSRNGHK